MTTVPEVLVVEDEDDIALLLNFGLTRAGYRVRWVKNIAEAKLAIREALPAVVVLDWMLPDGEGVHWLAQLRQTERTLKLPVLMLTARAMEEDKLAGLESGADDYITKPFSPKELIARIQTVLRRAAPQLLMDDVKFLDCVLRAEDHGLQCADKTIPLGKTEYKLFKFFLTHPNKIYSRIQLLDLVWGDHVFIEERTVDVHVLRLRKILQQVDMAEYLETVRGLGYRWRIDAPT